MAEEAGQLSSARRRGVLALGALLLGFAMAAQGAQSAKKNPSWAELTAEQQQILAPLSGEWDKLEPTSKRKWLGIAKRYPKMTPVGQKRAQTRMQKWVKLSPEQRSEAREKYRRIEKMPPEKRQKLHKRWAEYQALPPAERQKLAPPKSDTRPAVRKRPSERRATEAASEAYLEW
jgi:hypothetical protein